MRTPKSFYFFWVSAAVFVLQHAPVIEWVLLLLLAPAWSIFLINVGFLGIVYEVWRRKSPRIWLVLPLLWYGIYFTSAIRDHHAAYSLQDEYSAQDPLVFKFNEETDSLVLEGSNKLHKGIILHEYELEDLYIKDYLLPLTEKVPYYRKLVRASKSVCEEVTSDRTLRDLGLHLDSTELGCIASYPSEPIKKSINVEFEDFQNEQNSLLVTGKRITIRKAGERSSTIFQGESHPLAWFPMLEAGVNYHPYQPSLRTHFKFRTRSVPLDRRTNSSGVELQPFDALGLAIGLSPRVGYGAPKFDLTNIAALEEALIERQLALLDKIMSTSETRISISDLDGLRHRPELYAKRLPRMVSHLEKVIPVGTSGDHVIAFSALFRAQPRETVMPFLERLTKLQEIDKRLYY